VPQRLQRRRTEPVCVRDRAVLWGDCALGFTERGGFILLAREEPTPCVQLFVLLMLH
jgi:hypothetical protein